MNRIIHGITLMMLFLMVAATSAAQSGPTARALVAQNSPLKVSNVTVASSARQSVVTYSLENTSQRAIKDYTIKAVVYDAYGRVRSGDIRLIKKSMLAGEKTVVSFIYQSASANQQKNHVIGSEDILEIIIITASGDNWTWKLDREEVSKALKLHVTGSPIEIKGAYN